MTTSNAPESAIERVTRERHDHNELAVVSHRIDAAHESIGDAANSVKAAMVMTSNVSALELPEFTDMPSFSIKDMRAVLQVMKDKHFSKAADAIGMSQPGLSRIVQRVERGVGYRIFKRTGHGVEETDKGKYALAFFHRVCAAVHFVKEAPVGDQS